MNKLVAIILDGWGLRQSKIGNAIEMAKKPNFDKYWAEYPHLSLEAAGEYVGLPPGQIGTSEVNHFIIGAGRVVYQDLARINKALEDGSFYQNKAFLTTIENAKKNNSDLHIIGIISDGGVHSHEKHAYALLQMAKDHGLSKVYVHVFCDGRDTLPSSAAIYVQKLEDKIKEIGVGKISTVCGRFLLDRDHNYDRTKKAFLLLTKGEGQTFATAREGIEASYKNGVTDEFMEPIFVGNPENKDGLIGDNDSVIFINFRNDRPRQLTEMFLASKIKNLTFVTMAQYGPEYKVLVAFPPIEVKNSLGETISKAGLTQVRIAETEKFAHITFFLNCKYDYPYPKEDRVMFNSYTDIKTHDEKPYMRTPEIAGAIIDDIKNHKHDIVFANICNCDMVGHSGNIPAIIVGVETIDKYLKEIVAAAQLENYDVIITADHGNAEEKLDEKTGERLTAHSTNPVPFILISNQYKTLNRDHGELQDIAPTILKILDIPKPSEMTGKSFI